MTTSISRQVLEALAEQQDKGNLQVWGQNIIKAVLGTIGEDIDRYGADSLESAVSNASHYFRQTVDILSDIDLDEAYTFQDASRLVENRMHQLLDEKPQSAGEIFKFVMDEMIRSEAEIIHIKDREHAEKSRAATLDELLEPHNAPQSMVQTVNRPAKKQAPAANLDLSL